MRKALYILGQLSDLDVEWMIRHGRRENTPRGHILIQQGRSTEYLYLTLSGLFSVVDERQGGRELARLGTGEVLGEMSFVDALPPSATVQAFEDGTVMALPRASLLNKFRTDTGFAARFYKALAVFLSDRLRQTNVGPGASADTIEEDAVQEDELDPNVLDHVHLAGARFEQILMRFSEA